MYAIDYTKWAEYDSESAQGGSICAAVTIVILTGTDGTTTFSFSYHITYLFSEISPLAPKLRKI